MESDSVAKALQDLITILHIKKLVLGIDKSSARYLYIHMIIGHYSFSCQMTGQSSLCLFLVGKQIQQKETVFLNR